MKDFIIYTGLFALSLVFGWAVMEIREIRAVENPEWCLVDSVYESGPGEYEYRIMETKDGFKMFQKCSKIGEWQYNLLIQLDV